MSEQISEQISALIDGELPEAELSLLLRQVERQPSVLEQAYRVQQAHVCSQGDAPICLTDALQFSNRLHAAIRDNELNTSHGAMTTNFSSDEGLVAFAASQPHGMQNEFNNQGLDKVSFANVQGQGLAASNDSRWRPLLGAGIAAAVALVAVNAWQYQGQNTGIEPSNFEADNLSLQNFETPTQIQTVASIVKPKNSEQENKPYTVPNFENLNTDISVIANNDFRQVGYSDDLLQNNVAPQSTIKQLSRFAQEQRATIYQEQYYIDPRSGQIILSIKPIIE